MPTKLRAQLQRLLPSRRPSADKSHTSAPFADEDDDDDGMDQVPQQFSQPTVLSSPNTSTHSPSSPGYNKSINVTIPLSRRPEDMRMPDRPRNGNKLSTLRASSPPSSHHAPVRLTDLVSSQTDPSSRPGFHSNNNNTTSSDALAPSTPPPQSQPQQLSIPTTSQKSPSDPSNRAVDFEYSSGIPADSKSYQSPNPQLHTQPEIDYASAIDFSSTTDADLRVSQLSPEHMNDSHMSNDYSFSSPSSQIHPNSNIVNYSSDVHQLTSFQNHPVSTLTLNESNKPAQYQYQNSPSTTESSVGADSQHQSVNENEEADKKVLHNNQFGNNQFGDVLYNDNTYVNNDDTAGSSINDNENMNTNETNRETTTASSSTTTSSSSTTVEVNEDVLVRAAPESKIVRSLDGLKNDSLVPISKHQMDEPILPETTRSDDSDDQEESYVDNGSVNTMSVGSSSSSQASLTAVRSESTPMSPAARESTSAPVNHSDSNKDPSDSLGEFQQVEEVPATDETHEKGVHSEQFIAWEQNFNSDSRSEHQRTQHSEGQNSHGQENQHHVTHQRDSSVQFSQSNEPGDFDETSEKNYVNQQINEVQSNTDTENNESKGFHSQNREHHDQEQEQLKQDSTQLSEQEDPIRQRLSFPDSKQDDLEEQKQLESPQPLQDEHSLKRLRVNTDDDAQPTVRRTYSLPIQHTTLSPTPTSPGLTSPTGMTNMTTEYHTVSPSAQMRAATAKEEIMNADDESTLKYKTRHETRRELNEHYNQPQVYDGHQSSAIDNIRAFPNDRDSSGIIDGVDSEAGLFRSRSMTDGASEQTEVTSVRNNIETDHEDNDGTMGSSITKGADSTASTSTYRTVLTKDNQMKAHASNELQELPNQPKRSESPNEPTSQFTAVYDINESNMEQYVDGRSDLTAPETSSFMNLNTGTVTSSFSSSINNNDSQNTNSTISNQMSNRISYPSRDYHKRHDNISSVSPSNRVQKRAKQLTHSLEIATNAPEAEAAIMAVASFTLSVQPTAMIERQLALDETGALTQVLRLQAAYPIHGGIQAACAATISALRFDDHRHHQNHHQQPNHHQHRRGGGELNAARALDGTLSALQIHRNDVHVLNEVLLALDSLARLKSVRKELLPAATAIHSVVNHAMRIHMNNVDIQTAAVKFLAHAAIKVERNQLDILESGAITCALTAAKRFERDRQFYFQLSLLLRNITVNTDMTAQAMKIIIHHQEMQMDNDTGKVDGDIKQDDEEEVDIINVLLEALRSHGHASTVATHAMAALFHISSLREGCEYILTKDNWEQALVHAASRHPSKINIQTMCLAVMGRVVSLNVENNGNETAARKLLDAGAVRLALGSMHRFINRRNVLYHGAIMVRSIMQSLSSGMEEVIACGGIERLLDLLYCTVVSPIPITANPSDESLAGYSD